MTANAMQGDREVCLDAGMDDYIPKPIRIDELPDIIARWGTKVIAKKGNLVEQLQRTKLNTRIVDEAKISFLTDLQTEEDLNFFVELIEIYLSETPKVLLKIEEYFKLGDSRQMAFYAHKMKGSSVALGMDPISNVCDDLEMLGKKDSLENADILIKKLKNLYEISIKELNQLKRKYTPRKETY